LYTRLDFHETPRFQASARIFMRRQDFRHTPTFSLEANIYVFANILGGHQYFMILLDFVAANICVYFQYLFMHLSMHQYFWRNCFNLRFKINVVVMII
jgi:hypothetical protein